jgi:hypothetical protein
MPTAVCQRCGFEWDLTSVRKDVVLCSSCRAVKVLTVHGIGGKCLPHHGHFAEDMVTPLDHQGEIVMPGGRTCHHSDCVNPRHHIKE